MDKEEILSEIEKTKEHLAKMEKMLGEYSERWKPNNCDTYYYIDSEGSCSSHDCECIKCIHNVCFYKDYKAKEQECEELKKELHKNFKDVAIQEIGEERLKKYLRGK